MWFLDKWKAKISQEAERRGALLLADKIKAWHKEQAEKQVLLESKFDIHTLTAFKINIWDEIEDDAAYGYINMSIVPDDLCFEVLHHVMSHIRAHGFKAATLRYFDSTVVWPSNLLTEAGTLTSFCRWNLHFPDVDYEQLDKIVSVAKRVPPFLGKPIRVISES